MEILEIGTYIKYNRYIYEIIGITAFGYKVKVINPIGDDYTNIIGFEVSFVVLDNYKNRAKLKEYYYYIDDILNICKEIEMYNDRDNIRYEIGNYFLTREDAVEAYYSIEEAFKDIQLILNNG